MQQPPNPYGGQPQHGHGHPHHGQAHPDHPHGAQPGQPHYGAQPTWGEQPQQAQPGWGQAPQQQPHPGWGQASQPQWGAGPAQHGQPQPGYGQAQPGYGQAQPGYGHPGHDQPQPGYGAAAVGQSVGYGMAEDADVLAAEASPVARGKFIERTYAHLAGAIAIFVLLSAALQMVPGIETMVMTMISDQTSWLVVLLAFIAVSYIADKWASRSTSLGMQYAGLGLYTLAEVVIFVPMIYIAKMYVGAEGIMTAGAVTLAMFAAMTGYVFVSKADFSWMRGMLGVAALSALAIVFGSLAFGYTLGLVFSVAMVALACGYILFYTSNILHHYRTTQHVAAALALFSAVALLFWYILRIFMRR